MKLRPHHVLCIQKFTGHGYDETFTERMTKLVDSLRSSPDTVVTLVPVCDDVCGYCPNNCGGRCRSHDKVERMDREVMSALDLRFGERVDWRNFAELARSEILLTPGFDRICGRCEWYELCKNTES